MPKQRRGDSETPADVGVSETAGGIPDDAIGPEQRTVPEQLELAESETADAMAAKLQAEVDEHRRAARRPSRPTRSVSGKRASP
ncbi:MAG: hypothetical protein ACM3W4_07920 [Ignavibacteriales bacterium]